VGVNLKESLSNKKNTNFRGSWSWFLAENYKREVFFLNSERGSGPLERGGNGNRNTNKERFFSFFTLKEWN